MLVSHSIVWMKWPMITTCAGGETMVASVSAVLNRFKTEWATQWPPEAIIGACEEAGYTAWRDRILIARYHHPALSLTDSAWQYRLQSSAASVGLTVQRGSLLSSPCQTPATPL